MKIRILLALALILSVTAGCLGLSKKTKDQILAKEQQRLFIPEVTGGTNRVEKPIFGSIRLGRFTVLAPFDSRSFVLRRASGEYVADFYNGWMGRPDELIANQTALFISRCNLFSSVHPFDSALSSTYGLEGLISNLFVDCCEPERPVARITLRLTIFSQLSPLYSVEKSASVPVSGKGGAAVAKAFSSALEQVLAEAADAMRRQATLK